MSLRLVAAAGLAVFAALAGMIAWGALSNLWADYRDSTVSTYLLIGLPALVVAAAAGAVLLLRRR